MPKKEETYINLIEKLDEVMAELQNNGMDIDRTIALYEEGMKLTRRLTEYLEKAEHRLIDLKSHS